MAAAKADDISTTSLLLFFAFWYLGNYYYNIFNKNALTAASDLPLSIATLQLGVGAVYALIVWIIGVNVIPLCGMQAPSKQSLPGTTLADIFALLPVSICSAGAHSASVFAMGGSVAFAQIVKAGEPVFAAVVNTTVYGKSPSFAKWCTLPIIVGGVAFACLKPNAAGAYELSYDMVALVSASVANLFAAFKGSENQKVSDSSVRLSV